MEQSVSLTFPADKQLSGWDLMLDVKFRGPTPVFRAMYGLRTTEPAFLTYVLY